MPLTLYMLSIFFHIFCRLLNFLFFLISIFKKNQEYDQDVKQFGLRSGLTFNLS